MGTSRETIMEDEPKSRDTIKATKIMEKNGIKSTVGDLLFPFRCSDAMTMRTDTTEIRNFVCTVHKRLPIRLGPSLKGPAERKTLSCLSFLPSSSFALVR